MTDALPEDKDIPLAKLREDLQLLACDPNRDGARVYRIHDPVAQRFFEIDLPTYQLLSHWAGGSVNRVKQRMLAQTGRTPSDQQITDLSFFLEQNELILPVGVATVKALLAKSQAKDQSVLKTIIHSYLFFKLPLVKPDRFLTATMPLVSMLFTRTAAIVVMLLGLLGLFMVSRQWDSFIATFPDRFDTSWLITIAITVSVVKVLHELGHAYVATWLGSRVSTIGVAFIVLWPVMYTDSTDAWRLRSKRERTLIDASGVIVELGLASIATFVWAFLPDGAARDVAFTLAATSWILSLAINLNPLMRFDGYFLLSDAIGIPNLQGRSFEYCRWHLRETLFKLDAPKPESCSRRREVFYVGFAWAVWIYRLFLFIGIALLVYHMFFKALGIALFVIEIAWFIALPIIREFKVWWSLRSEISQSRRAPFTAIGLVGLLMVSFVPMDRSVSVPVVIGAAEQFALHAPRAAQVVHIHAQPKQRVQAGAVLFELNNPDLVTAQRASQVRVGLIQARLDRRGADAEDLAQTLVLKNELQRERQNLVGLAQQIDDLIIRAPVAGVIADIPIDLHKGRWINSGIQLGLIVSDSQLSARGYISADALARIEPGSDGRIQHLEIGLDSPAIQVAHVGAAAARTIDRKPLASVHGGTISTNRKDEQLVATQSLFEITAIPNEAQPAPLVETVARLQLEAKPRSPASLAWQQLVRVFVRESTI